MSINIPNRQPYPQRTGPGMPDRDWAHVENQGTNRVNRDIESNVALPAAVVEVLLRAGWDGVSKLSDADARLLHDSMDQNGHSFAYNILNGYPEHDTDPNTNPEGEPAPAPTPEPATPQQVKDAEAAGKANVRQDIAENIGIMQRKGRSADEIVAAVLSYCANGSWPARGRGPGGEGGGLHLPGTSS